MDVGKGILINTKTRKPHILNFYTKRIQTRVSVGDWRFTINSNFVRILRFLFGEFFNILNIITLNLELNIMQ